MRNGHNKCLICIEYLVKLVSILWCYKKCIINNGELTICYYFSPTFTIDPKQVVNDIWEIANYRTICYFRNLTIIKINCRELLHQNIYYIFIIMYLLGAKCRFIDLTEASTKFDHNLSSKNLCLINCAITTSNKIPGICDFSYIMIIKKYSSTDIAMLQGRLSL
jgi:hypothetical protein